MKWNRWIIVAGLLSLASTAVASPTVTHGGLAAPDIIEIVVHVGKVNVGVQVPYVKKDSDTLTPRGHRTYVYRDGRKVGVLVGPDQNMLRPLDTFEGEALDISRIGDPSNYWIRSADDERYRTRTHPRAIHRKHKPVGIARTDDWKFAAPLAYHLFLTLPHRLQENATYTISIDGVDVPDCTLHYRPEQLRSESIHVSHLGFTPDGPVKLGFLSCWMGDGGGLEYQNDLPFHVLSEKDGSRVYSGRAHLAKPATVKDEDAYQRNFNLTNVYELDFSPVKKEGDYRLYVEGIGCSYPFRIGADIWQGAFVTAARGFFHQRSGIALGPPYTTFQRPRSFHPDDGVKIYASTTRLMDTRNGLSRSDPDNFRNLVAGATDELVAHAWGGYMDAGDWDRRIQHLVASIYLLDLAEQFSDFFREVSLNIPESANGQPDIIDEALFNLDCYRRLQTPPGGVRGGIESEEHPNLGETSWQETLRILAYAPGSWSSYYYAGVATKAAGVLKALGRNELARVYEASALRAMEWAEKDYAQRDQRAKSYQLKGVTIERLDNHHQVRDMRNYAAAELFRLTGDERWQRIFRETTKLNQPNAQLYVWQSHEQREAAWVYVRTERDNIDTQLQQYCRQALLREAQDRLRTQARTGFRWTKNDWAPPTATLSVSDAVSLVRAHILTQDAKYLKAIVLACQTGLGANPLNLCYTTGLGHRRPHLPLHLDSRHTGQAPPEGLTVFGPVDPTAEQDLFLQTVIAPFCYPPPRQWPIMEAYWDVFWYPMMCEFTIHHPMSYNAYTWGYLAAIRGSRTAGEH
ncbi:MAG: glycoside hydrolase family 9 protein [Phycisphaerales bacterium]|nr:MAG: glycoside hydrolase family 9 protein [Phycisphaerales bacterium]